MKLANIRPSFVIVDTMIAVLTSIAILKFSIQGATRILLYPHIEAFILN